MPEHHKMFQLRLQAPYQVVPKHVALGYIKELREMIKEAQTAQALQAQKTIEEIDLARLNQSHLD